MSLALANRSSLFLPIALVAIGAGAVYYGQLRDRPLPDSARVHQLLTPAPEQSTQDPPRLEPAHHAGPRIQVAILLDTSSSMSGLIDQARSELWTMVNAMDDFAKDGQHASIEIALYEYGNSGLDSESGYLRQVIPFSSDLDGISEALFSLTTGGGSEHAGQVIERAGQDLRWRNDDDTVRAIYIAGNESFAQGPVAFTQAIADAKSRGIRVNTVYCGDENQGRQEQWAQGASLGEGRYLAIDHNRQVHHIAAPQDDEIAALGRELNETYVYYGTGGRAAYDNQRRQDDNAASYGSSIMVERSVSKSKRSYNNHGWDLVDATAQGQVDLSKLDTGTLPAGYRGLDEGELQRKIDEKSKQRKAIQTRLGKLQGERSAYIEAEKAGSAKTGESLDSAMIGALQAQATELGFEFQ
jgi:hypothetical protein